MKFKCTKCNKKRKESDFAWKNKSKGIKHKSCKECAKKASSDHYAKNKTYYIKKASRFRKKNQEENRSKLKDYLSKHHCIDCGESDPVVLQFDHVRGNKSENISTMFRQNAPWKHIEKEIHKCDVRCANCHARKTAKTNNHYKLLW